ncbi:MAG TPA: 2Fe-2S iron-sulfur cluster-binding protein, partial [Gemmatimonadaceae bacterium]|nr:2Fe-2S iron-sulfur cluster-binding protein [Gemmatimonadaceae bacterium]
MRLTVNGSAYDVPLAGHETLLGVLRGRLAMTGTKLVCGHGECGACTVLLDGVPAYACLTLAAACEGVEVTTIEGIGAPDRL